MISISNKSVLGTVSEKDIEALKPQALAATQTLEKGDGAGNDFLGWLHLPSEITADQLDDINATAKHLREQCDYVVKLCRTDVMTALLPLFHSFGFTMTFMMPAPLPSPLSPSACSKPC